MHCRARGYELKHPSIGGYTFLFVDGVALASEGPCYSAFLPKPQRTMTEFQYYVAAVDRSFPIRSRCWSSRNDDHFGIALGHAGQRQVTRR